MNGKTFVYILKRFLLAVVTVWVVITLTFFVMHAVPGGPFTSEKAVSPEVEAALKAKYGLDKPLMVQYFTYLKDIVTKFDFGPSLKQMGRDVITIIGDGMKTSARIGVFAAVIALIIGIVLGSVNSKIKIAENEAVIKAIGTVDEAYKQAVEQLNNAKKALESAEKAVLEAYNTYFVSADSKYQQAVKDVLNAKAEYNKQKAVVAEMADGPDKKIAEGLLAGKKTALDIAEGSLEGIQTTAEGLVKAASTTFDAAYEAIDDIKAKLPAEIKTKLEASVKDIDKAANTAKDKAFETFEKQYKPQIIAYDKMVKDAQKTQKKA